MRIFFLVGGEIVAFVLAAVSFALDAESVVGPLDWQWVAFISLMAFGGLSGWIQLSLYRRLNQREAVKTTIGKLYLLVPMGVALTEEWGRYPDTSRPMRIEADLEEWAGQVCEVLASDFPEVLPDFVAAYKADRRLEALRQVLVELRQIGRQ